MNNPLRTRNLDLIREDLPDGQTGDSVILPNWVSNRITDPMGKDFLIFLIRKEGAVLTTTGSADIILSSSTLEDETGMGRTKLKELILLFTEFNILSFFPPNGSKKMTLRLNDIRVWFNKR